MQYAVLLGRILFSSIFILRAFSHFSEKAMSHANHAGLPLANLLVPFGGVLLLLGGLSILLGYKARLGAWLLIIFLLPTTFAMHKFWNMSNFYSTTMEQLCFLKNISLIGSSLLIAYFGSGPLSLDKHR
jgi:putative oxidoreductase